MRGLAVSDRCECLRQAQFCALIPCARWRHGHSGPSAATSLTASTQKFGHWHGRQRARRERLIQAQVLPSSFAGDPQARMEELLLEGVQFVRVLWVDVGNVLRCDVVPIRRFFTEKVLHGGLSFPHSVMGMPPMLDQPTEDPVGNVALIPDLSTLLIGPEDGGVAPTAFCLGDFLLPDGTAWLRCPRAFLMRQEEQLRSEFGLHVGLGFELEFSVLSSRPNEAGGSAPLYPSDRTVFAETSAMRTTGGAVAQNLALHMEESLGIEVQHFHPESAHGQFEIAFGNLEEDALKSVSNLVTVRDCLQSVAAALGVRATTSPKPIATQAGNAVHLNLSLLPEWSSRHQDHNLFEGWEEAWTPEGVNAEFAAENFVAGVLEHLPSLMAVCTPSAASHARLQPGAWAGVYQCWGLDNKEVPLRVVTEYRAGEPEHPASSLQDFCNRHAGYRRPVRLEVKLLDGTANPFLATGMVLAAGMDGMRRALQLPEPVQVDPHRLSEKKRPPRLPQSPVEALRAFESNEAVREWLGADLAQVIGRVRRAEIEYFNGLSANAASAVMVQRY